MFTLVSVSKKSIVAGTGMHLFHRSKCSMAAGDRFAGRTIFYDNNLKLELKSDGKNVSVIEGHSVIGVENHKGDVEIQGVFTHSKEVNEGGKILKNTFIGKTDINGHNKFQYYNDHGHVKFSACKKDINLGSIILSNDKETKKYCANSELIDKKLNELSWKFKMLESIEKDKE